MGAVEQKRVFFTFLASPSKSSSAAELRASVLRGRVFAAVTRFGWVVSPLTKIVQKISHPFTSPLPRREYCSVIVYLPAVKTWCLRIRASTNFVKVL